MKKIIIVTIFFASFSCQKESIKALVDQNTVSLSELKTAALNINLSDVVKSLRSSKAIKSQEKIGRIIDEILPVPDQNNPSYYIVNYQGGGWVIIAGDKRINPILGFSDESRFQTSGTIHYGLLKWLNDLHQTISKIKSSPVSNNDKNQTSQMWNQLGILPCPDCGDGGGGCVPSNSTVSVGPLLTTQWSQDCPYNGACPTDPNGPCGHDLTGCVATAMAQVLNYWKKPVRYNWPTMQPNSIAIYGLMSDAGVSVGMSYGPQESGAQATAIAPALKNTFGYSSAIFDNFNFSTLASDLYYSKEPLILTAFANQQQTGCFLFWCWGPTINYNGHCWVADGYQIATTTDCSSGTTAQTNLIHMNWGWAGQSNGWYNATSWTPTGTSFNFQYVQQMVHGIHP
ncbi:MAG: C10 family peptidase [Bacteroidetes bacterium]|nr:C10 family peptidase [Bacteroidota bacterium]